MLNEYRNYYLSLLVFIITIFCISLYLNDFERQILYVDKDNATDIQTKLDSCSDDGCVINIQNGTYNVTSSVSIDNTVYLYVEKDNASDIQYKIDLCPDECIVTIPIGQYNITEPIYIKDKNKISITGELDLITVYEFVPEINCIEDIEDSMIMIENSSYVYLSYFKLSCNDYCDNGIKTDNPNNPLFIMNIMSLCKSNW